MAGLIAPAAPDGTIHHGRHYRAVLRRVSDDPLVVVNFEFWWPDPTLDGPPTAEAFFTARGINFVGIRSARNDWFQHDEILDVLAAVRAATPGGRRVGYGGSMGGFAVINFAHELELDSLLAVCPQYSIDRRRAAFEHRWAEEAAWIDFRHDRIGQIAPIPRGYVVFDPATIDAAHVRLIRRRHPLTPIEIRFGGHDQLRMLTQAGVAAELIVGVVTGRFDHAAFVRQLRAGRRDSGVCWLGAAEARLRRGHLNAARRAVLTAKTLALPDPGRAEQVYADILRRLDERGAAASARVPPERLPGRGQAGDDGAMSERPTPPSQASIDAAYPAWVREHDMLGDTDRAAIRAAIPAMTDPPTLSLLLPLGFAPHERLRDTLESVRGQLYPHWQLCVAGVPRQALRGARQVLAAFAPHDPRIRIADAAAHADRAGAANAALAEADGDFVALLAEGDVLPPHALYEVAAVLAEHRDSELLYTDEDRIDAAGARVAPRFKTGWDPDLLLAHDYIGGLAVFRRETVVAAGGLRPGFGAALGYDLTLRATATMPADRIRHLPSVLYHRPAPSTPWPLQERMLGLDAHAARRAVQEFLGPDAKIRPAPLLPTCNRVTWPVPTPAPMVSIIMPTRDRAWLFGPAAYGVLERTDYPSLELLIVDNGSEEDATFATFRTLSADRRVRVLPRPGPFNFSALNNFAVREASGDIVVLLNNDINVIAPDWLSELVGHAMRPEVGAVGAKLFYGDGRVQHAGVVLGPGLNACHMLRLADRLDPGYEGQLAVTRGFSAVTGACLAMRRAVFLEIGGLDEQRFAVAFNDIDLCLRLGEFGYRVVWTPFAELFHLESLSRGTAETPEDQAREISETDQLWRQWRHSFDADPFHNPNMSCAWHVPLHLCPPRRAKPWRRNAAA